MIEIAKHCIRCGLCIDLYPELFAFDELNDCINLDEKAQSPKALPEMKAMAEDCPVAAIVIHHLSKEE